MKTIQIIEDQCLRALEKEIIIYPIFEDKPIRTHFKERLQISEQLIDKTLGKITIFNTKHLIHAEKVHFVGLGKFDTLTEEKLKNVLYHAFEDVEGQVAVTLSLFHGVLSEEKLASAIIESYYLYHYRFKKENSILSKSELVLLTDTNIHTHVENTRILFKNMNEARDLGNTPANLMTPEIFKNHIESFAKQFKLPFVSYDFAALEKLGAHAIIAVGKGSKEKPYLISVKYQGNPSNDKYIAFVGKGVTFDSGGYSLKPSASMKTMKLDMCGATNTFAAFKTIVQQQLKVNVHLVIATCENMISSDAYKLSDVIQTLSGKTIEITNTDAEGRLILVDAITYARKDAEYIIDMATLTGACVVALGHQYSGIFSNNDSLSNKFTIACEHANESVWRLPVGEKFISQVKNSDVADYDHAPSRMGGASVAATLLQEFAQDTPWLHVDIAGTANLESSSIYMSKGATGAMIPSLVAFAKNEEIKD